MLAFYIKESKELVLPNLDVYTSLLFSLIFFFWKEKKKKNFCSSLDVIILFIFPFPPPLLNMSTLTFCCYSFYEFIYSSVFMLYIITINAVVTVTTTPFFSPHCCHHHLHHHSPLLSLPPLPPITSWCHTITIIKLFLSLLL